MAPRSASILRSIRWEIFGESQEAFAERLKTSKDTILRQEGGKARISPRHMPTLRALTPPKESAARWGELLAELEEAVREESREWEARRASKAPRVSVEEAEAARDEQLERIEELVLVAQDRSTATDQLLLTVKDSFAEHLRKVESATQRSEDAARSTQEVFRRAEELSRTEAARRAEEVGKLQEAQRQSEERARREEQQREAFRRSMQRLAAVAAVVALVTVASVLGGAVLLGRERPSSGGEALAHVETQATRGADAGHPNQEASDSAQAIQRTEMAVSAGLDGGTVLVQMLKNALPMPKAPLPGQMVGPCPEWIEEINGMCWARLGLTPAQVRGGACDSLGLYEPSEGWCRAHQAGYQPFTGPRKNKNSVEDE